MDALPGIGHACGHNLIAASGVAVACAIKAAMEKFDIAGSVVLLGTPGEGVSYRTLHSLGWCSSYQFRIAEEGGSGKAILLEKGAYKGMDACLM